MPTITYQRLWCKPCNDWALFDKQPFKPDATWDCKECKTPHEPTLLGDIPEEKILEQRKRYNESEKKSFGQIGSLIFSGLRPSNPFSEDYPKPEVIECDAGQKLIDEQNRKKYYEEYQKKQAEKKLRQEEFAKYRNLSRNDICLCGSGKKYKKCCSYKYENI